MNTIADWMKESLAYGKKWLPAPLTKLFSEHFSPLILGSPGCACIIPTDGRIGCVPIIIMCFLSFREYPIVELSDGRLPAVLRLIQFHNKAVPVPSKA